MSERVYVLAATRQAAANWALIEGIPTPGWCYISSVDVVRGRSNILVHRVDGWQERSDAAQLDMYLKIAVR